MGVIKSKTVLSMDEYREKYKNDNKCFTDNEVEHLKNRSSSTGAGFIALKEALKNLIAIAENVEVNKEDIELSHDEDGAPVIKKLPKDLSPEKIKISISHTKTDAVGLAAMEKKSEV